MKKFIIILAIIAVLAIIILPRIQNKSEDAVIVEEDAAIAVESATAATGDLALYTHLTGTFAADEAVNVMPTAISTVTSVDVKVGDTITKDAVLFTMSTDDMETQLNQASKGVTTAALSISQARVGLKSAEQGYAQAELAFDMAQANYDMNIANYNYAVSNLSKYETLLKSGIVSQAEYDQLALQAAPETKILLDKQLQQAEEAVSSAALGLENARLAIDQAQNGYDQAQDGVATVSDTLSDFTVTAPIDGIVTAVNVTKSQYASNAMPAVVISNIDRVKVTVQVTENLVNQLKSGQPVDVIVPALKDQPLKGTIDTVSPASNAATLLYPVTIYIENPDHLVKPGMFASVSLLSQSLNNVLYVPTDAILIENGTYYVYRIADDTSAQKTAVEVGLDTGIRTEIKSGLSAGDRVVTVGLGLIDNDTKLNIVEEVQ